MAFAVHAGIITALVDIFGARLAGESCGARALVTIIVECTRSAIFTRHISAMIFQLAMGP